jgi:hypothetical protein
MDAIGMKKAKSVRRKSTTAKSVRLEFRQVGVVIQDTLVPTVRSRAAIREAVRAVVAGS